MNSHVRVIHLGRLGDVAGGMTQFINESISWSVPGFSQELLPSRSTTRWSTLMTFGRALRAILALDSSHPVLVIAHLSQGGSFVREGLIARLAHRRGVAVIAHVHGSSFPQFAARHPRLVARTLGSSDRVIVLSEEARRVVADMRPATPVMIVANGVSEGAVGQKEKLVLFGGVVSRRKGVDVLLEAWRMVRAGEWRLVIAGPVAQESLLVNLPSSVDAVGSLPRDQFRELLSRAAVAVLPSRAEGMPLFVLEALSSRAVVLGTEVGAISAVVDGTNGLLVPADDAGAMAQALQALIDEPELRNALAERGAESFRALYSPSAIIPRLALAWSTALEQHASGASHGGTPAAR